MDGSQTDKDLIVQQKVTNFIEDYLFKYFAKELHPAKASYPGRPRLHGKFSSKPGRISVKSTDISVKRAGSLLIKTHVFQNKYFINKVTS